MTDLLGGADISWIVGIVVTAALYYPWAQRTSHAPAQTIYPDEHDAVPVFSDYVLRRLRVTAKAAGVHGSVRQKIWADRWGPSVAKHRPEGAFVGDMCEQCGKLWPCHFIRGLLQSGMVVPPPQQH